MGGAVFITAGESAFENTLLKSASKYVPGIDPSHIISTGASNLGSVFQGDQLLGIKMAYVDGLKAAFAVTVGAAGLASVASLFLPWHTLPGLKQIKTAAVPDEQQASA